MEITNNEEKLILERLDKDLKELKNVEVFKNPSNSLYDLLNWRDCNFIMEEVVKSSAINLLEHKEVRNLFITKCSEIVDRKKQEVLDWARRLENSQKSLKDFLINFQRTLKTLDDVIAKEGKNGVN